MTQPVDSSAGLPAGWLAVAGPIDDLLVPRVFDTLEGCVQPVTHLILTSGGGMVSAARRLILGLRDGPAPLVVVVPDRARSAGTLACLGASEVVLMRGAVLGPIDNSVGAHASGGATPVSLSAEDVRMLPTTLEDWFGIDRSRADEVISLLCQHVFPPTITSLYRGDRFVRGVAGELLREQLPDADEGTLEQIVDQLVRGYFSHDFPIMLNDAIVLGLNARGPTSEEAAITRAARLRLAAAERRTKSEHGEELELSASIAMDHKTWLLGNDLTEPMQDAHWIEINGEDPVHAR